MRASNKNSNRLCGIMDTIKNIFETGGEYVNVSLTEKTTTAAQDMVVDFAEKFGLDKFLPQKTVVKKLPGEKTGLDPKKIIIIGGISLLVLFLILKRK